MSYFIIVNHVQQGPFTLEELRTHGLTAETLVWTEGMEQWVPAWQVDTLRPLLAGQNSQPIPTVPPSVAVEPNAVPPTKKNRSWLIWLAIVLMGLGVFMAITNPSKNEHRQAISLRLSQSLNQIVSSNDNSWLAQGVSTLSRMLVGPLMNEAMNNMLQYHNYLFFSTTSVETTHGTTTTSYGLFGKVFTADEDKIVSMITKSIGISSEAEQDSRVAPAIEAQNSGTTEDASSTLPSSESPADTVSLSKKISNSIIDQVGHQVKKQIQEHADSTTSNGLSSLVDELTQWLKKQ